MGVFGDVDANRPNDGPLRVEQLVEQAAREHADRTAVVFGDGRLTYRQLNDRADVLCRTILHHDPGAELIGISTTRSLELVIGLLAILKAGKAYLPLDPTYPERRLHQLVQDSGVQSCLTLAADAPVLAGQRLQVIPFDQGVTEITHPVQDVNQQNSVACVLYTSGSTGQPKGVRLGHAGLINLLSRQLAHGVARPGVNSLQFCHLSFDASFGEIFVSLLSGGTLHLIDDTIRLDSARLLYYLVDKAINRVFLPYVALQYLAEAADTERLYPVGLREVITGGELLRITPPIARLFTNLPDATLMNVYGPTEASVWVTELRLTGDALNWPALPTIGTPIPGVDVFVLGEDDRPVPNGEVGELGITGIGLADGYLNQPERTAERFIRWMHPQGGEVTLYRTGDLGRYLPDNTIEFHGRRDGQVKIRGNRIELGEIELALAGQPGVRQAVAIAREDVPGQKRLVAYVVVTPDAADAPALRHTLSQQLPDFMIPAQVVVLDSLPETTSGKVDRNALPQPDQQRPDLTVTYRKPTTALEKTIAGVWVELLQVDPVGIDDNFFELGGNSLLAQRTVATLSSQFAVTVPITKLYQYPTIAGVAGYVRQTDSAPVARRTLAESASTVSGGTASAGDIAVIGMAGRFPGANTIEAFWDVLKQGRETTRFFTSQELDASIPQSVRSDPAYVPARGVIDGADQFDAAFFGLNPKLAELMDPQQRVFLEIAYEALEQTGHLPATYGGSVGVYAGCGNNTYYLNNVHGRRELVDPVGTFQVMTVNEKDYIASRTAYQLNLKGPAVSVYSACSTSLLAIAQAVESLRTGQCDVALAGGASITAPVNSGHLYQEGAMLSPDGHCRSFDADARGTVFSDGAGVVLLKPLAAARRDGDTIYAIIKGVGVNNDGGGKGSFTAPNAEGQAGAIRRAIADARVDAATIRYVEAHGTATPVGDPIEIDGLTMAFGEQTQTQFCAIGSVKSNMGHLTQAAGVAGLIKTVLALYHRQIPASLGFTKPNPAIDFANSPFYVNTQLADWPGYEGPGYDGPRRAGVSSFGVGGTNVHVVLEEYASVTSEDETSDVNENVPTVQNRPMQLLTWSARTAVSRHAYAKRLSDALRRPDTVNLADAAFTLQTGRPALGQRRFVVAAIGGEAADALVAEGPALVKSPKGRPDEVVFLFPGQGAQFLNMGRALYEHEPSFRQAIDACADILNAHLDLDIRAVLYPQTISAEAEQRLRNTRYTQPALFVTEYALARLWISWGIEPTVFCGHSIGEFVAAHLSGVFSLADALMLVATRGRLMSELGRGSMLSVRMSESLVQTLLPATLSMAAVNSRNLCVVAGPDEHIADFARRLDEQNIPNRLLLTSHAFHSAMMDPIVGEFAGLVANVSRNRPQKPIVSTRTGTWLTDADATDPQYWAGHLRDTVRFADALDTLLALENPLLLEVGPGKTLATLTRQQAGGQPVPVLPGIDDQPDWPVACRAVLTTLGQLYQAGLDPNWPAFYVGQRRKRTNLPTYVFDRKRCWVDPIVRETPGEAVPVAPEQAAPEPLINDTNPIQTTPPPMRHDILLSKVNELLEEASGIDIADTAPTTSFLEIGLDSLLLTQVAITLKNQFGVPLTFRQLNTDYTSPQQLAAYLDRTLPADQYQPAPVAASVAPIPVAASAVAQPVVPSATAPVATAPVSLPVNDTAFGLITQQLQLLAKQMALLQGVSAIPATEAAPIAPVAAAPAPVTPVNPPTVEKQPSTAKTGSSTVSADVTPEEAVELKKPFGATARIERQTSELTGKQQDFLGRLTQRYNQKTGGSKQYAQQHRAHMADPRVVSGFRPLTKELVYPLVINRSKGSRLWDIDGNEYIDALNGFGSNMFGYQPDHIKEALHEQIENGFEVGPQHELAGEVAELICELTGSDRAALCSTGSEAVLGAMRVARTITGRSLIVAFTGSYHGIVDEVIVRGTKKLKSFPAAPGIMPEAVQNMLILDYGTDESLRIIRDRAHELAAVLVEPVQSRRPEFVPVNFLNEVRTITAASGTALIFDEVITGFRMHPGGAQALFGIRADLCAYGKVVGAGMPIGVIAGKREFMDALDGGFWQYGDDSVPEVGVTYFAGTFVRHPMALAAARASLSYIKEKGPQLQQGLTRKAKRVADALNAAFTQRQLPLFVAQFGSLWKLKPKEDILYGELLFTLMRERGIHIWDGFPCFMTEAHTEAELDTIISRFIESVDELAEAGFFDRYSPSLAPAATVGVNFAGTALPAPGARLGRDPQGNPGWFLPNPDQPGKYMQVELR